ncbi:CLUMA_CG005749, isoform A [Clunio marinus]|uniref:RNA helicase n=1 Tax=Clunio marinus TaxID=568069 RepID=A0A1J1I004_9DIPT|nr:CLUMA_CG005749, isoform A [Clunio marinus]
MEDSAEDKKDEKSLNFHQMELDDRILKAIAKLGWMRPTMIQEKAIPLILEKKDVLIRARTGSGKTASFSIPIIQKILNSKESAKEQTTTALILAPSKELCQQSRKVIEGLTIKCSKIIRCIDLTAKGDPTTQKHSLAQRPDIVISTPARILSHLVQKNIDIKESLETMVIDEADLMFSFGFENDLKNVLDYMPAAYQSILASATLSDEVMDLKKIVLHNPVVLKLEEPELPPITQLSHYHLPAEENDKAAILYTLFKLHLIKGKSIIFVNTVDKGYKLKLFLWQFKIRSCVLNSELPAKIRIHTVHQFNQGLYDIIIASDERSLLKPGEQLTKSSKTVKTKVKKGQDSESGVARGIDFRCVSNVINFDFPLDINSYIHRAGRTARGNNSGNVLSFVSLSENDLMNLVEEHLLASYPGEEMIMKKHQFKLEEVEPFRYRAQDGWRAITKNAVKEARLREIKAEMYNSEKLKTFFENNPHDLQVLRHDKPINVVKVPEHLAEVPEYIIPAPLRNMVGIVTKKRKHQQSVSKTKLKYQQKADNPLAVAEIDYAKKQKKF